jgi:cation transport regulator ChaC
MANNMANNLFQQAKNAVNRITNGQGAPNETDKQAARNAIQSAYTGASPQEQQQLQQLEQQLEQNNELK